MLEVLSILVECVIVALALMLALQKQKVYGYTLALTFAIYVLFDATRKFDLNISDGLLEALFLVASLSALWSVWSIYKEVKK